MPEPAPICPHADVLVEITRGSLVESCHLGVLAVTDASGRLLYRCGDPGLVAFLRSSAKPMQAAAVVESGAADAFGFTPAEIAISASSHNGEPFHTSTVAGMLAKLGLDTGDLSCGVHAPLHAPSAALLQQEGAEPCALHNNCSGKHAGMLALSRQLNVPTAGYHLPSHPVQERILAAVSEIAGLEPGAIARGIDGCGVPVFAMPVASAALAFARMADPRDLRAALAAACRRVVAAMQSHPEMVGGTGRFDTDLMRQTAPRVFCKGGAEGFYALGLLPDPAAGRPRGLGLALKVVDGDTQGRARPVAVVEALRQLGVLTDGDRQALSQWAAGASRNHRGDLVGEVRPALRMRRVRGSTARLR